MVDPDTLHPLQLLTKGGRRDVFRPHRCGGSLFEPGRMLRGRVGGEIVLDEELALRPRRQGQALLIAVRGEDRSVSIEETEPVRGPEAHASGPRAVEVLSIPQLCQIPGGKARETASADGGEFLVAAPYDVLLVFLEAPGSPQRRDSDGTNVSLTDTEALSAR